jgi:hypothetical protein
MKILFLLCLDFRNGQLIDDKVTSKTSGFVSFYRIM